MDDGGGQILTRGQLGLGLRGDGAADGLVGLGDRRAEVLLRAVEGPVAGVGAAGDGVALVVAQRQARGAGVLEGAPARPALGPRRAEEVRAAVFAAQRALLAWRAGVAAITSTGCVHMYLARSICPQAAACPNDARDINRCTTTISISSKFYVHALFRLLFILTNTAKVLFLFVEAFKILRPDQYRIVYLQPLEKVIYAAFCFYSLSLKGNHAVK